MKHLVSRHRLSPQHLLYTSVMDVGEILPRHWLDPVVVTDDNDVNFWVWTLSWLVQITSIISIAVTFARAIQRYRQRNPSAKLPRAFWLFLALAAVAFLITTGLRYEHKRLKYLVSTGHIDLDTARRDTPSPFGELNEVDQAYAKDIEYVAGKLLQKRYYQGREEHLSGGTRWKEMVYRLARDRVRAAKEILPVFRPTDWPKRGGTWDYLDMLVDAPERMFWTVQWTAAWFGWTLYLLIECERRALPGRAALSFACLGGMVSLAGGQALFFAMIVLAPASRTGKIWIPKRWIAICQMVLMFCAFKSLDDKYLDMFFRDRYPTWPLKDRLVSFNTWKFFAFFTGLVATCQSVSELYCSSTWEIIPLTRLCQVLLRRVFCYRMPIATVQKSFTAVWIVLAIGANVMFIKHAAFAYAGTDVKQRHWFFLRWHTHPWMQRRNPMDHHKSLLMEQLGVFGDHHWINALAFDVLISVLTLACWSVIGHLDARAMVRCALCPWVDDMHEQIKLFRYHTMPDALASGGLRGGGTRSGRQYLLDGDLDEGSIEAERGPIQKGPQRKARRSPSREPEDADYQPAKRGRPRRDAPSRAASQ